MKPADELSAYLTELQLRWPLANYEALAEEAAGENWTHADYLRRLLEGECQRRRDTRIQRRIQAARFPVIKTLETFHWNWPKKINRASGAESVPPQVPGGSRQRDLPGRCGRGQNPLWPARWAMPPVSKAAPYCSPPRST